MTIKGLMVLSLKVRSLYSSLNELTVRFKDFDILCFCETWLSSSYTDQMIEIEGFEIFRLDRETGNILNSSHRLKRGGGLIIYVKKDLSKFTEIVPEIRRKTENVEQLWIKINKPNVRKQVIAVIYRPPSDNITKSIEELTLSLTFKSPSKVKSH